MIKKIEKLVIILALHGAAHVSADLLDAIQYIESYQYDLNKLPFCPYEIQLRYSNGDSIVGTFNFKDDAIQFLNAQETHTHKSER